MRAALGIYAARQFIADALKDAGCGDWSAIGYRPSVHTTTADVVAISLDLGLPAARDSEIR